MIGPPSIKNAFPKMACQYGHVDTIVGICVTVQSRAVVALSAEGKFEVLGAGKVPENLLDCLPIVLPRITEGLR
jgi:hypothetical protein